MAFTLITVTATYKNVDQTIAVGYVTFQATAEMQQAAGNIQPATLFKATLDPTGKISVVLPATDDPTTLPTGVTYAVTEQIVGAPTRIWQLTVPRAVTPLDLSSVVPATLALSTNAHVTTLLVDGAATFTAGPVVIGADPGGAQLLRVGGTSHFGGLATFDGAMAINGAAGLTVAPGDTTQVIIAGGAVRVGLASAPDTIRFDYSGIGVMSGIRLNGGLAISAERPFLWSPANTSTLSAGFATQRFALFDQQTLNGAFTITNAATVAIAGAPIAAGGATITNPYSLWVQAGTSRFDGGLKSVVGARSFNSPVLTLTDSLGGGGDAVFYYTVPLGSGPDLSVSAGRIMFRSYSIQMNRIEAMDTAATLIDFAGNNVSVAMNGGYKFISGPADFIPPTTKSRFAAFAGGLEQAYIVTAIIGATGQTGDLTRWYNAGGTILASVAASGLMTLGNGLSITGNVTLGTSANIGNGTYNLTFNGTQLVLGVAATSGLLIQAGGLTVSAGWATLSGTDSASVNLGVGGLDLVDTTAAGVGIGPQLSFGGASGNGVTPYKFAVIRGEKNLSGAGDYSGALRFKVVNAGGGLVELLTIYGNGSAIGFYGHTPVSQPAAPVTLADVIAIIRGNGLSA
jgi:hypothetical protein